MARANDFAVLQLRAPRWARAWARPESGLARSPGCSRDDDGSGPEAAVEAIQSLIKTVSSPLLIALDDCHLFPSWFPGALTRAVTQSLAGSPIALVLAWRDAPHMPTFELDPDVAIPEHRLEGLSLEQARSLLAQQQLELPSPEVLASLVGATAGNPQALLDVWHRLDPDQLHGWRPLPEPTPIGDAVAGAFGVRVEQLPDEARRAVAVAAAGRVPVDVLELVLDELDLSTEALLPAEEAGILVVRGNRLDFLHPLVRAASFRLLPEALRSDIHQGISRAFARSGQLERSAFHASQNASAPDDALTRLYGQAARVALDRGDPNAAARHEEMASAAAETSDTRAHHLSRASALWLGVGQTQRALVCLDRAQELHPSGAILAEVIYGRARARANHGVGAVVADEMLSAAALCESETPHRAVLMLADAAACRSLEGVSTDAADIAERAVVIAVAVSSHAESLAKAALGAVAALDGRSLTAHRPDLRAASSMLIGQTQRFSASPHLAYVIGMGLLLEDHREQAVRWAQWIERCAETLGDRALSVVAPLLESAVSMRDGRLTEALGAAETAVERATACENQTLAARALATMVEAHAARGEYEAAFERASRLFALSSDTGREPRMQTLASLANLELQRGRPASAFAWLRATEDETTPRRRRAWPGRGSRSCPGALGAGDRRGLGAGSARNPRLAARSSWSRPRGPRRGGAPARGCRGSEVLLPWRSTAQPNTSVWPWPRCMPAPSSRLGWRSYVACGSPRLGGPMRLGRACRARPSSSLCEGRPAGGSWSTKSSTVCRSGRRPQPRTNGSCTGQEPAAITGRRRAGPDPQCFAGFGGRTAGVGGVPPRFVRRPATRKGRVVATQSGSPKAQDRGAAGEDPS